MAAPPRPAWLLLGPTGSGKSPLGDEIERRGLGGRRCAHFDFGAVLRSIAADPGAYAGLGEAEIGAIRASLASGALFEAGDTPMIIKIVEGFAAARELGASDLVVFNGLPRHIGQAESLAGVVGVVRVVLLDAPADVIGERMRRDPGGDREGRPDGSAAAVRRRLADYRERTLPLADHFRRLGVPVLLIPVTAAMTAGEMYERLAAALGGARTDFSG